MKRAELQEIVQAVDAAAAYVGMSTDTLAEAVDLVCDHQGITSDADRRIVRKGTQRRLEREAERARRSA